jgi:hypothetical protein
MAVVREPVVEVSLSFRWKCVEDVVWPTTSSVRSVCSMTMLPVRLAAAL